MAVYNMKDIYVIFRQAQSDFYNRGWRMPKDWNEFINNKMKESNKYMLERITNYFNTIWHNIDPSKYFEIGFKLFGHTFSYHKFFDKRILNLYKQYDKNEKREMKINKQKIIDSIKFIIDYMNKIGYKENISLLLQYSKMKDGFESVPIYHYKKGYIDQYILVWMIYHGHLKLTNNANVPYITDRYKDLVADLYKLDSFIKNIDKNL